MDELKDCPFCGSNNLQIGTIDEETVCIECNGCNASGGYFYEPDSTSPEEATTAWNTRTDQAAIGELVETIWAIMGVVDSYTLKDVCGDGAIQEIEAISKQALAKHRDGK